MNFLLYWKQIALVALLVGSYLLGAHNESNKWETAISKANTNNIKEMQEYQRKSDKDSSKVTIAYSNYIQEQDSKIKKLSKEIDNVKAKNDSKCNILNGTIDIYDSMFAVQNKGNPTVQGAASNQSGSNFDDTSSTITLSEVVDNATTNFNICNIEMKKLDSLQEVVRDFQKKQDDLIHAK